MNPRLTFVLMVVLVIVGGYVYLYEIRKPAESNEPIPPFFYSTDMHDIEYIHVQHDGQSVAFTFSEERNRWEFDDEANTPVDDARWGGITLLLEGPRTDRVIMDNVDDPAKYGLDPPKTVIRFRLKDSRELVINIGNPTPNGSSDYMMLDGSTQLVTVNATWSQVFRRLVTEPPYLPTPTPTQGATPTPSGTPVATETPTTSVG